MAVAIPAAGLALYGIWRILRDRRAHFPGHEYLGPGSDVSKSEKKPPVDHDDWIALQHDRHYQELLSEIHSAGWSEERFHAYIQQFDHEAITEFITDFEATGNWHSFLGALGLSVKLAASEVGIRYPTYPSK